LFLAAVLAGAQGYILKNIDSDLLIRSIHSVCAGQSILNPVTRRAGLDKGRLFGPQRQSLSPQEERVLALVAEGLTNKEIGAALQLKTRRSRIISPTCFKTAYLTPRPSCHLFATRKTDSSPAHHSLVYLVCSSIPSV
jgi:FixJ family two-component response regulator